MSGATAVRACGLVIAGCLLPRLAAAESDAERYFHEGKRLLKAGQLVEACASLARSQELSPRAGTLLNLGECQEQRGQTATARDTFVQAKALAVQSGDKAREREAERRIASLEPRLSRLTLVVPSEIAALEPSIRRNDLTVEATDWNKALAVDPDTYTIHVTVRGHRTWSTRYKIEPKQDGRVVVGPLVVVEISRAPIRGQPAPAVKTEVRHFGLGLLLGMNVQHESGLVGVRMIGAFEAPGGQIRAIGNFYFSRYADEPSRDSFRTNTFSFGANADYIWMPRPTFGIGGGLGIGADYDAVTPELGPADMGGPRTSDLGTFLTLRVTPIVLRLRENLEAGVHLGAVIAGDEVTLNATIAVDWFLW